ncbi:SNF2 family amino-terminal protein, partial [Trifolium pratense]
MSSKNGTSNAQNSKVDTRMVKLISWYKEPSILGISYTLFKNLAGNVESEDERGESENEKRKVMGNFLRKVP